MSITAYMCAYIQYIRIYKYTIYIYIYICDRRRSMLESSSRPGGMSENVSSETTSPESSSAGGKSDHVSSTFSSWACMSETIYERVVMLETIYARIFEAHKRRQQTGEEPIFKKLYPLVGF